MPSITMGCSIAGNHANIRMCGDDFFAMLDDIVAVAIIRGDVEQKIASGHLGSKVLCGDDALIGGVLNQLNLRAILDKILNDINAMVG